MDIELIEISDSSSSSSMSLVPPEELTTTPTITTTTTTTTTTMAGAGADNHDGSGGMFMIDLNQTDSTGAAGDEMEVVVTDDNTNLNLKQAFEQPLNIREIKHMLYTAPVPVGDDWNHLERRLFLNGLMRYGRGSSKTISENMILSRSSEQVEIHESLFLGGAPWLISLVDGLNTSPPHPTSSMVPLGAPHHSLLSSPAATAMQPPTTTITSDPQVPSSFIIFPVVNPSFPISTEISSTFAPPPPTPAAQVSADGKTYHDFVGPDLQLRLGGHHY